LGCSIREEEQKKSSLSSGVIASSKTAVGGDLQPYLKCGVRRNGLGGGGGLKKIPERLLFVFQVRVRGDVGVGNSAPVPGRTLISQKKEKNYPSTPLPPSNFEVSILVRWPKNVQLCSEADIGERK